MIVRGTVYVSVPSKVPKTRFAASQWILPELSKEKEAETA